MYNKLVIVGRLGGDPEQSSENGPVKFSVATSRKYKDKSGEQQESTQWHRVEAWGKLGEICSSYLKKGKLVLVEGEVEYREYDGKWYTSVRANEMKMLDKGGE